MSTIGEKMVVVRKRAGLSQEDVACLLEVSRQTVSHWENGSNAPTIDKLFLFCKATGININYFDSGVERDDVDRFFDEETHADVSIEVSNVSEYNAEQIDKILLSLETADKKRRIVNNRTLIICAQYLVALFSIITAVFLTLFIMQEYGKLSFEGLTFELDICTMFWIFFSFTIATIIALGIILYHHRNLKK